MARRALTASLVLAPFAAALAMQGCTQDFSTFDPTGSGGGSTTSTASSPTTTTGTSPTTTTGPGGGGEGGSTTVTSGGGGGSPPIDCTSPSDCDDGELCTTDACNDGTCANTPLEDGTLEPDYVDDPLDCQIRLCQGGVGVDVADEDDDPEDEACREVICVDGAPEPGDPINEGSDCGGPPLVCEAGVCTGCANDGQCPDPLALCLVGECNDDGTCGEARTDVDPVDDDGDDCRMPTCDGSSDDPIFVADATDTPPNGVCGVGACNGMTPVQNPAPAGTACSQGGAVCDGSVAGQNACVVCTVDGGTTYGCNNAATPVCDEAAAGGEGVCVGCLVDGDCGDGEVCDPTTDMCVGCVDDGDCDGGQLCNPATDTCVECIDSGDCTNEVCDPDTNTCETCASNGGNGVDLGCESADGLNPRCNEATRTCTQCSVDGDCSDNPRGDDCRNAGGGNMQCGCNGDEDCGHDEAIGGDCSGAGVCQ